MYESHWRLECRPFEQIADARFYYPSESHQGALLKLRYTVENRRGAVLLCGAAGGGKTLLVSLLKRQLSESYGPFAHLVFPKMPVAELLNYLATELGAPVGSQQLTIDGGIRRIQHRLEEVAAQDKHAVAAIDEAHIIDDVGTFDALRMLLNFEPSGRPGLTLILVGQPSLLPLMDRMPGLEERLGVKCLLRPLSIEETFSYVNHRMSAAGAKQTIFQTAALETLHELTQGSARRINRLCDLALLVGFAEDRHEIGPEHLEAVSQELMAVTPE